MKAHTNTPRKPLHLERVFDRLLAPKPPYQPSRKPCPSSDEAPRATALVEAVERGDAPLVRQLLGQGVDPGVLSPDGRLALNECLLRGRHDLARCLVDAGADPRAMDRHGQSAMGLAWRGARGGTSLDPTIAPQSCGADATLLGQWEARFGRHGRHELFSAAHQDWHMGQSMGLRLDLEGQLSGGLGHEGPAAGMLAMEDITHPKSLVARQRERAARLIPRLPEAQTPLPSHDKSWMFG